MLKIACVFPGQGTQVVGMGKELFKKYKKYIEMADRILGYSVEQLCLENPMGKLDETEYTQVAVFIVNALSYIEFCEETRIRPDYVAGHSLGEYNALLAAGVFDMETGLNLVRERGKLMSESKGGGMLAVIGLSHEEICKILIDLRLDHLEIANWNTVKQIVLSGSSEELDIVRSTLKAKNIYCKKLQVSGAFHSSYMKTASEKFAEYIQDIEFKDPLIPVISNVTAELYKSENIRDLLTEQIYKEVKWFESMRKLIWLNDIQIVGIGNGKILNNMISEIKENDKYMGFNGRL